MKSLVTLALVLAGIGLIFLGVRPTWTQITSLRVQNMTIEGTLVQLRQLQNIRNELLAANNSISRANLDRLYEILPTKSDSGQLLVSLERLTREHGLRLRKVELETADKAQQPFPLAQGGVIQRDASPVNIINYVFTFSASYEAFKSLLVALENNLRLVDITDISFVSGETNSFEFTLRGKSYYQKEKAVVGSIDRLQNIKIDTSFFSDSEFLNLIAIPKLPLESVDKGRINPFLRR